MFQNGPVACCKVAFKDLRNNLRVGCRQFSGTRKLSMRLCMLTPLVSCKPQIKVWNGIVGQSRFQLPEECFRFGVLARKPQHYSKVLASGQERRIACQRFSLVCCGFIELITFGICQRRLMCQFPVCGIRAICSEQLNQVCPGANDDTDGEANNRTHKNQTATPHQRHTKDNRAAAARSTELNSTYSFGL